MKKVLLILGGLIGIVVLLIALIPMFVDVNKYRPQIVQAVEENLNAEVQLGKLSLNLWGGVNIAIEKLMVFERGHKQVPVFGMTDAKLRVAFMPLLTGKLSVTLKVVGPQINVVKYKDGKMNVMNLMKPAGPQSGETPKTASGGKSGAPPLKPDVSVEITDGKISYADELTGMKTGLSGLTLGLYHLGVNQPIEVKFQSDMDVKGIKDLTLKGSADLSGVLVATVNSEGFQKLMVDLKLDATDLTIKYGALFNKDDKVPLKLDTKLETSAKDLNLQKMHLVLKDLAVDTDGAVQNFDAPVLNLHIRSSKFVLEDWNKVIGMLKEYDASGEVRFDVKVTGPVSNVNIAGDVTASKVSAKVPALVQPITNLTAALKFTQDSANLQQFSFNIGQSDLAAQGTIKGFNKPIITVGVNSKLFDLDAMLPKKTPEQIAAEKKQEEAAAANKKELTDADIEKMTKGPLDAIRNNPYLRGVVFNGRAGFQKIIMNKAPITDAVAEISFANLVLTLKKMSAKAFNGSMNLVTGIDFKPRDITYKLSGDVTGLDINAAITSQMETLKDTVMGKTYAKFDVSGAGVTKGKAKQHLVGKGSFRLENGSWSALKVLQQVGEKLSSIPGAKDKVGAMQVSGKIKKATSDFTIGGGRFNIVNLVAELEEANTGVTGQGYVDFDKNMVMAGRILTPGQLPAPYKHSDGRASVPYEIGCLATAPCFKAEATIKPLAEAMGKEEAKKAATQGLQKLKENVKDENVKKVLDKIDNKQVEDVLNKLKF